MLLKEKDNSCPNITLCNLLSTLSEDAWKRISFARTRDRLKIFETTITQNILYEITAFSETNNIPIKIFEALDENTNGNDIDIYVKHKQRYYYFPTQAKIIYTTGKYPRLNHGDQILSLMKYAKDNNGLPLYLLYNFFPNWAPQRSQHCNELEILEYYGCTIIDALYIFSNFVNINTDTNKCIWNIPHFLDLHDRVALPWNILACDSLDLLIDSSKEYRDYKLREFTEEEVFSTSEKWVSSMLKEPPKEEVTKDNYGKKLFRFNESVNKEYSPKFKLILDKTNNE